MYFNASLPLISGQNNYRGSQVKPCGRLGKWVGNGFKLLLWSKEATRHHKGFLSSGRPRGLKEAIKGLCNGISNVSLPLKTVRKTSALHFVLPCYSFVFQTVSESGLVSMCSYICVRIRLFHRLHVVNDSLKSGSYLQRTQLAGQKYIEKLTFLLVLTISIDMYDVKQ